MEGHVSSEIPFILTYVKLEIKVLAGLEVLAAKYSAFWDIKPFSQMKLKRHFRGTYRLQPDNKPV